MTVAPSCYSHLLQSHHQVPSMGCLVVRLQARVTNHCVHLSSTHCACLLGAPPSCTCCCQKSQIHKVQHPLPGWASLFKVTKLLRKACSSEVRRQTAIGSQGNLCSLHVTFKWHAWQNNCNDCCQQSNHSALLEVMDMPSFNHHTLAFCVATNALSSFCTFLQMSQAHGHPCIHARSPTC